MVVGLLPSAQRDTESASGSRAAHKGENENSEPETREANSKAAAKPAATPIKTICSMLSCPAPGGRLGAPDPNLADRRDIAEARRSG